MKDDKANTSRHRKNTGVSLEAKLREALKPDETVLWQGAPEPRYLSGINVMMFGIAVAFSILPFIQASNYLKEWMPTLLPVQEWVSVQDWNDASRLFLVFDIFVAVVVSVITIFAVCGLALIGILIWWIFANGMRVHKMTLYAVTDKRAIIVRRESSKSAEVNSYLPNKFKRPCVTERRNGLGDIAFRRSNGVPSVTTFDGFINIRNPRDVERILQTLASAARSEKQRRKRK